MTTPTHDEAAVVAAKRICPTPAGVGGDYINFHAKRRDISRIITDAYAKQMEQLNGFLEVHVAFGEGVDGIHRLVTGMIETRKRLTAEREVRKELVEIVKQLWTRQLPPEAKDMITAALVAAEKLEKCR